MLRGGKVLRVKEEVSPRTKDSTGNIRPSIEQPINGKVKTHAERLGLKSKAASLATSKQDPPNLIKIMPENTELYNSSDETKEKVQELITPNDVNLKVRNLRRIQGNGILVETGNKENIEALLASEKLKRADLSVGIPQKKNPRVIIYDAPVMENDDRLFKAIIDQNANEEEGRKIRQQIKIAFKTDKNSHNIIIDASKEVRDIFIRKDRLYIGWSCCKV